MADGLAPTLEQIKRQTQLKILAKWCLLIVFSFGLAASLEWLGLPAGLLMGPMIIAIIFAVNGAALKTSQPLFIFAQGIVGIMIASNLPVTVFGQIWTDWSVFLFGTMATVIASTLLGWAMTRSGLLPGTTAIWGSSPGGATLMTLMCESYGADMRLVAFMQYMRVLGCVASASLVAMYLGVPSSMHSAFEVPDLASWISAIPPVILAFVASAVGVRSRIPGGAILLPMSIGIIIKIFWPISLALPLPVLALSYAVIGWGIGARFSMDTLRHAAKAFTRVLGSVLLLILICACIGAILTVLTGIDLLTALLATSPGGLDAIAIIATSTHVDISFVLAMQTSRYLVVAFAAPILARSLSAKATAA
ncbi:AbrB family transcriptional regulator [Cohaesibacter haloalkalitolerans]|uniref:AbrB family transcriptional regulator n=1 Tax=Cohaesibacter haloalkalitolerans TaxID=1162980 RepID=UPI0013C50D2C|nr:AbrB family transcriptional regulator [Cohaesibacter haloalkalitolerans]